MPARRNKASGKKLSATAGAMTEEPKKEEPRPVVTQVVEVVEEDMGVQPSIAAEGDTTEVTAEPPLKYGPEASAEEEHAPKTHEEETPSEERKSLVEELYTAKKEQSVMPEISMHKAGSKKPIMVWAVVTIIVALLTGGVLVGAGRSMHVPKLFARPTPTPTPAPPATPTPTPAPVDKSTFDIKVLNGGGTPGAAGKMKSFLEDKGYKVASTGNTDTYTYDTTEIHGKPTMTDAIAALKVDLKDSYSLGTVAADLDASASADIEVIVGKE